MKKHSIYIKVTKFKVNTGIQNTGFNIEKSILVMPEGVA